MTNHISPLRLPLSQQPIVCRETELGAQQLVVRVSLCNPSERGSSCVRECKYEDPLTLPRTELQLFAVKIVGRSGTESRVDVSGEAGTFPVIRCCTELSVN